MSFRVYRPWGPFKTEDMSLDSLHVALLARSVMAERVGRLLGEKSKLSAAQVQKLWHYFDVRFACTWLPELVGDEAGSNKKRPYAEVRDQIERIAEKHWLNRPGFPGDPVT